MVASKHPCHRNWTGTHLRFDEHDHLTISHVTSERLFELAVKQAQTRRDVAGTPGHVTLLDESNMLRSNASLYKIFDEGASAQVYIGAGSMMLV